ncbi:unnamed protein product [Sphacelaria rigidula]
MTIKQLMAVIPVVIVCLLSSASAFVTSLSPVAAGFRGPASVSSRTTSGAKGMLMGCRVNAKKEKRQRNRDNMRKFNKRGVSRKKVMRVERQQKAAEAEAEYVAQIFHSGMDDWVQEDILNE